MTVTNWLLGFLFSHQHTGGWPMRGQQVCVECGAARRYRLGEKPGPWQFPRTAAPPQAAEGQEKIYGIA